jgi:hypothetical protein
MGCGGYRNGHSIDFGIDRALVDEAAITECPTPRGEGYRIIHHIESQVYLEGGFLPGPVPGAEPSPHDEPGR